MRKIEQDAILNRLAHDYFSDPARLIWLQAGNILLKEGSYNSRLYFVRSGNLIGYVENEDGSIEEVLSAGPNNFIGVYSFFSKTYSTLATIKATSDCELAYIEKNTRPVAGADSIEKEFMPVAVKDLMNRQKRLLEVSQEKQQTLKKLMENQKLASLGQMAAGIAHELNNSIAVLSQSSEWLAQQISPRLNDKFEAAIFETGLIKGRFLSSREIRAFKKELKNTHPDLCPNCVANLAQMGLTDKLLEKIITLEESEQNHLFTTWEMAVALHDMQMAAEQSAHVVKSVKSLGNQNRNRQKGIDINNTIQSALTLLHHRTRNVTINLELNPLPEITANIGEFIQIWTNLIKNSCEAMQEHKERAARLDISSELFARQIKVKISDSGPGIPKDIFSQIFQPNVTTKVTGLSFGLGLGLTIIQRIINEYNGKIDVKSSTNGTSFTVFIPVGGNNE